MLYPHSATAERFQAVALAGQLAYALLCLMPPVSLPQFLRTLNTLAVVLLTAGVLHEQWPSSQAQLVLHSRVMAAHTAARSGITDLDYINATLSHPLLMDKRNMVAQYDDYLRTNRLGYHNQNPVIALHQHLELKNLPLCNQQTPLADKVPLKEVWLVHGNPNYTTDAVRLDDIVILNDAHTVVGYAYAAPRILLSEETFYTGYANTGLFTGTGTAVGIKNNKLVCANTITVQNTAGVAR